MKSVAYEELLQKDGRVMTHVVGSSMLPLLHDRQSIVIVESVQNVPPERGDVVLYKTNGTYILHRIRKVTPEEYLIRGDNTWTLEHIPRGAILATMTGFYRTPEGKLITKNNLSYRLYRAALPAVRLIRRGGGKARRIVRKALRHHTSVDRRL